MVPIKEALTFDDVTLVPKFSEILPSDVDTSIILTKHLKLKIPILSSAMDTVTESKMAIKIGKAGGIGVIHRNLNIEKQIKEIRKVKSKNKLVGAAVGASEQELKRTNVLHKEFQNLLDEDFKDRKLKENEIIKATITEITKNFVVVDCKAKMEGMIPIEEFKNDEEFSKLKVGSVIEVFLERIESFKGQLIIKR